MNDLYLDKASAAVLYVLCFLLSSPGKTKAILRGNDVFRLTACRLHVPGSTVPATLKNS